MDFNRSIFENRQLQKRPFLASHRGVCGANIPCNTLLSYQIAINQGADVVELDVTKSLDGTLFAFHPGMEKVFLKSEKGIPEMTAEELSQIPLVNQDGTPTHYRVPTLEEALMLLKDKVYINVDKFWIDVEGITNLIRKCGVEKQAIVKTYVEEDYFTQVERFAPDLMFMPMTRHTDTVTELFKGRNIHFIGVEALFDDLNDEVATAQYIASMHEKGLLVWSNSILYNEKDIVSAGLTDDLSLEKGGDFGWGKLADMEFDFIQTDWLSAAKAYFDQRN